MCNLADPPPISQNHLLLFSQNFGQVLRDGKWIEEDASILVPGDIISVKLGDIIPADARLLEGDPLKIDQVLRTIQKLVLRFFMINLVDISDVGFALKSAVCAYRGIASGDKGSW